jgi:transposase
LEGKLLMIEQDRAFNGGAAVRFLKHCLRQIPGKLLIIWDGSPGRSADIMFLPSYSPDLNPIEETFSKIKHLVRNEGAYTRGPSYSKMRQASLLTPTTGLRIDLYEHRCGVC